MVTMFGRKSGKAAAPTVEARKADVESIEVVRGHLTTLQSRHKELESEQRSINDQIGEILAARLMGVKVATDTLQGLEIRKQENAEALEEARLAIDGLEARKAILASEQSANIAAIRREELAPLSADVLALQRDVTEKIMELGDLYDAFFAKREEFRRVEGEFNRCDTGHGHGLERAQEPMFIIPESYMRHGHHYGPSLRQQVETWRAEPARRSAEFLARVQESAAAIEEQRKREHEATERARKQRERARASGSVVIDSHGYARLD